MSPGPSTAEPAPLRPPPGRYGPQRAPRTGLVRALAVAGILAGLGLTAWLGLRVGQVPVEWRDVAFRIEGDELVEVTFDVIRTDPARPAACRVDALNEAHAQVGVVTVDVPPGDHHQVRLTTQVRTSERAVTGTVTSCRVTD